MALVKFYRGPLSKYDQGRMEDAVFFATDKGTIHVNGTTYGGFNKKLMDGVITSVDVQGQRLIIKGLKEGVEESTEILLLKADDKSILLGDIQGEGGLLDGSTIKVNVKKVGNNDGLKLGEDGLYVDLTNTNHKIEDERNARTAAINSLNATEQGGAGKFIQSVKEDSGIITAVAADLTATAVNYDKNGDKIIADATNVSAAIKELDAKVAANKDAELTYKTVKLTTEEVTALGDVNVKEAYKVVSVNKEGTKTTVGDVIKIYKDSSLVSIDYTETDDKKKKGQFLKYVYTLADGTEKTVYVDMSKLVDQAEVENGIQAIDGKLSIKVAEGNEADFLTVDANGLKLSGVQTAIDTAKNAVQSNLNAEITRATLAEGANKAAIDANAAAIAKLNGNEATDGSVAKAVADAKTELLGDAAEGYNTLGKLENQIQAVDAKASSAHTEVVAKGSGHVTVAVADSTDGTHKVVTISENDIASQEALAAEVTRAEGKEQELLNKIGSIESAVAGKFNVIGSDYIGVEDKTVPQGGDKGSIRQFTITAKGLATSTELGTLSNTVDGNTASINILKGNKTDEGSVAKTVDDAINSALTWVDVSIDTPQQ